MRAAAIFGLGTSPSALKTFQSGSATDWRLGLPAGSSEADAVVIFGGDGTLHRHLPALLRLQLPLLVVPAGSGNDFARALGLRNASDSLRAWRTFESGKSQPQAMDVGVIVPSAAPDGMQYFCTVATCGLDAMVARRANQMPRWLRAHGGYALALLPLLFQLPAFSMRVIPVYKDGKCGQEPPTQNGKPALLAAFANTQFYGDGMRIAPEADFTDGRLDICRVAQINPLRLLSLFPTVYFGHHLRSRFVEYFRAEGVIVESDAPMEIYADGEFVCHTPAEISIAAGALKVIRD